MSEPRPIVFACAGCSNAGRLPYDVARVLDAGGTWRCPAWRGVAAGKPSFLKKLADRPVWVIDGCPIECAAGVFEQVGRPVDLHIRMHQLGVRKNDPPDESRFPALVAAALAATSDSRAVVNATRIDG